MIVLGSGSHPRPMPAIALAAKLRGVTAQRLPAAIDAIVFGLLGFAAQSFGLWQFDHLAFVVLAPVQPVLLTILLRGRSGSRPARLAAAAAGIFWALRQAGTPAWLGIGLASVAVIQSLVALVLITLLLRGRRPDIARPANCTAVLAAGGLLAPAIGGLIGATLIAAQSGPEGPGLGIATLWRLNALADTIGIFTCLPCLLTCQPETLMRPGRSPAAIAGVAATAAAIFPLHLVPLPNFLFPVLVLASFIDLATTATCLMAAALIVAVAAVTGVSPTAAIATIVHLPFWVVVQFYLLSACLVVLPLALVLDERARLMRVSQAAMSEAMRRSEEKSRFIATVSHEIRTPMNGIIGFADLLTCTELSPEQEAYVQKVQGAAMSLLTLVNDLLDLAKVEAGHMAFHSRAFSLSALCAEVLDVARVTPNAAGKRLSVSVDPGLPDMVEGDPVRVQQVLLNLVANALAHTDQGSVHIEVGRAPCNPEAVRLEVHDTGKGIAEDRLPELFRPFAQLHDPRARPGGTGLGLAICKQIVEQMQGGIIGVQSEPGIGSMFWFELVLPAAIAPPPVASGLGARPLPTQDSSLAAATAPEMSFGAERPVPLLPEGAGHLTGLAGRDAFAQQTARLMAQVPSRGFAVAALRIGREAPAEAAAMAGDDAQPADEVLLRQAGRCLRQAEPEILPFHIDGSLFLLILAGSGDDGTLTERLTGLQSALKRGLAPGGGAINIGVARAPQDAADEGGLLACATTALQRAEGVGPGALRFFNPARDLPIQSRRVLMQDLRDALDTPALRLHYQPQTRIDGTIAGFVAMPRWFHPVHGAVPPERFMAVAEEAGVSLPIARWVLRTACGEAASWTHRFSISVNLPPLPVCYANLPDIVHAALAESGLPESALVLELNGGLLAAEPELSNRMLQDLVRLGVQISLDEFGGGTSSFRHLDRYPFNELKISRYFASRLGLSHRSGGIARAIVKLGRSLDMRVVAEGVETIEQLDFFANAGCDLVQGALTGLPRDITEYAATVRALAAFGALPPAPDTARPYRTILH